jgi:hypothetical protein
VIARILILVLSLMAFAATVDGAAETSTAASGTGRTVIAVWNPFTASGALKPALVEKHRRPGSCGIGPGSEVIGDYGYRCGTGNFIDDPCWRDGAKPTDFVVCPYSPSQARSAVGDRDTRRRPLRPFPGCA